MADSTIFDDVFRTEAEKMPELTIPLINEVFGTNYPLDTEMIQGRNEHLTKNGKKITDSYIIIGEKRYHMECQSTEDSMMILRMIEYDFAISLEHAEKVHDTYRMQFPHSCILYLRGDGQKKSISMELQFPDNQVVQYKIPVIRMEWYSIKEILEKDLIILLPFYIMRYEKMKQQLEKDEVPREKLFREYEMIAEYLEQKLLNNGLEKEFLDIRELISRIVEYSFPESKNVRKGLGEIMGGQVLELESDRLIKKGEQLGEVRGKELGKEIGKEIGKELGEEQMALLTQKLLRENRLEDLRRCAEDTAYRKKLLNEMQGISEQAAEIL